MAWTLLAASRGSSSTSQPEWLDEYSDRGEGPCSNPSATIAAKPLETNMNTVSPTGPNVMDIPYTKLAPKRVSSNSPMTLSGRCNTDHAITKVPDKNLHEVLETDKCQKLLNSFIGSAKVILQLLELSKETGLQIISIFTHAIFPYSIVYEFTPQQCKMLLQIMYFYGFYNLESCIKSFQKSKPLDLTFKQWIELSFPTSLIKTSIKGLINRISQELVDVNCPNRRNIIQQLDRFKLEMRDRFEVINYQSDKMGRYMRLYLQPHYLKVRENKNSGSWTLFFEPHNHKALIFTLATVSSNCRKALKVFLDCDNLLSIVSAFSCTTLFRTVEQGLLSVAPGCISHLQELCARVMTWAKENLSENQYELILTFLAECMPHEGQEVSITALELESHRLQSLGVVVGEVSATLELSARVIKMITLSKGDKTFVLRKNFWVDNDTTLHEYILLTYTSGSSSYLIPVMPGAIMPMSRELEVLLKKLSTINPMSALKEVVNQLVLIP